MPVADLARTDTFALARLARGGQLHGIEVVLDAKGEPMSGFLFLDSFNGMVSVSGVHQFERKAFERLLISGRMFTDGPRTFADLTWQYSVTFSTPIKRPPTAEETAAALKTPPAVAAAAHVKAILTSFDAFVATLAEPSAASYRSPGGRIGSRRFAPRRPWTAGSSRWPKARTGRTSPPYQGRRRDGVIIESSLTLRREGTAWKVER